MGQILLTGQLIAGPSQGSNDATFPQAQVSASLLLKKTPRTYAVATGNIARSLNSPLAFVALQGIGDDDTVTKGEILYLRSAEDIELRITTDDGLGGDVIEDVVPVSGLYVREFPATKFLKLLEAKGESAIEYFASGQL